METYVEQMVVNGRAVDLNLARVSDLEGESLICTFTSPITNKSYALFSKVTAYTNINDQIRTLCSRAVRAIVERENTVTYAIYRDMIIARGAGVAALPHAQIEPSTNTDWIDQGSERLAKVIKFEEWLREHGRE